MTSADYRAAASAAVEMRQPQGQASAIRPLKRKADEVIAGIAAARAATPAPSSYDQVRQKRKIEHNDHAAQAQIDTTQRLLDSPDAQLAQRLLSNLLNANKATSPSEQQDLDRELDRFIESLPAAVKRAILRNPNQ